MTKMPRATKALSEDENSRRRGYHHQNKSKPLIKMARGRSTLPVLMLVVALFMSSHCALVHGVLPRANVLAFGLARREALQAASSVFVGGVISILGDALPALAENGDETPTKESLLIAEAFETGAPETTPSFAAYSITPDSSQTLNPTLKSIDQDTLFKALGSSDKGGVIWLGEHHNSARDHKIQVEVIQRLHGSLPEDAPMAIGLEQVQVQYQYALDDYVSGKIDVDKMKELVQWETRWTWPFDQYQPIFETAKELGIRLVALNVDSEDLAVVERDGFPGLRRTQLQKYISDPSGFAEFTKPVQFRTYTDYVIRPSYDLHKAMGLLQYTISGQKLEQDMSFRNFFSGRILWDESMASMANAWTAANPAGLMIGLVGADHVKFSDGIPGRYIRMAGDSRDCTSLILNPTLIDTTPPGSVGGIANSDSSQYPDKIILQLRYLKDNVDVMSVERTLPSSTGGVLALADYIVVSQV